ncbi:sulfate transporter [Candidatus Mycobacterium wuenschmannii]|uniref:Sulfate transporter n=1 Tax=Candidatus Mycobacterium wuenschmannii TaxID=3027808 RepID=A0ABY8VZH9_9MYCO|nr:STAS domain-containing protein [Candidatus Mycobacterium wuenschmannii]WIM88296.1 sulfate transporter [Candidatus Mycobacterium wuenschmannii]
MAGRNSELRFNAKDVGDARVLSIEGVLDATTYLETREAIVKAILDEPQLVVVDVTGLSVREEPAWAVFTSVRWQTAEWPDVPVGLVSAHQHDRNALLRNGTTRHVPVYATVESALSEMAVDARRRYRRRARASIPAQRKSIRRCRELAGEWLTAWSRTDFIHVVSLVATELVEAALAATDTDFVLRLETDGSTVSVAIQHVGIANPARRKAHGDRVSGLDLVAGNSRAWGTYTTLSSNTIWAVVGPENRF